MTKQYTENECCKCGVISLISVSLDKAYRASKASFYCPNGHAQSYVKSTEQILNETLAQKDEKISELYREIEVLNRKRNKRSKK